MARRRKRRVVDVDDEAPVPLDIDPALVEFIILKARAFDAKTPPVEPNPGSDAVDDDERGILEDYPSDETEEELRDAISGLSEDAAIDLVALYWVGRGDFGREEWEEARAAAAERSGLPVADYLMGEPNLGDFLEEAMFELGYEPEEYGPE
jgi:hypothetical protein